MKYVRDPRRNILYRVILTRKEMADALAEFPNHRLPDRCFHLVLQDCSQGREAGLRPNSFPYHSCRPQLRQAYDDRALERVIRTAQRWLVETLRRERGAAPATPAPEAQDPSAAPASSARPRRRSARARIADFAAVRMATRPDMNVEWMAQADAEALLERDNDRF